MSANSFTSGAIDQRLTEITGKGCLKNLAIVQHINYIFYHSGIT